jgi:hypothetical protein
MKTITLTLLIILLGSCNKRKDKIKIGIPAEVLKKTELLSRNMLSRFQKKDSLEIKAAFFILDNLKYQKFSYGPKYKTYQNIINKHYLFEDTLTKKIDSLKNNISDDPDFYDVLSLNEEFLIKDIRDACKIYSRSGWKTKMPFDIFCQYILPYKINKEPLENNWRSYLSNQFFNDHDSSIFKKDIISATSTIHKWLYNRKKKFRLFYGNKHLKIPDLSCDILDKLTVGSCHELTALGVGYMRALGIPATTDFAPVYLNINAGHEWSAVVIDSLHCIPFDISADTINKIKKDFNIFSKVYRRTFIPVQESHLMQRGNCSFLPELFNNPFMEDVTHLYTKTSNIRIPVISSISSKYKFCYLCVFNKTIESWTPVAWGRIEKEYASFVNVGKGGVYLAATIESNGTLPLNSPFLLDDNGKIKFFEPDKSARETVKLLRKFRSDIFKDEQKNRMIGGIFQGANYPDFRDAVNLYEIKENPGDYFNNIILEENNEYRYVRYYSPKKSFGNVAEVEFYQLNNENISLKGKIIGTNGSYLNDPKCRKEAAFDGNVLTYFDSKISDYSWVGLDLGLKKKISKIRFIARNDMNGIQVGNMYELLYWQDGWKSMGTKIADTTFLIYEDVPKNSIFWLRNLTEGNEERIFSYENGKQVWW